MNTDNEIKGGLPVPEAPSKSNTIAEIFLYRDKSYGVNTMFQYDLRKFGCSDEIVKEIIGETCEFLMEKLKAHKLFGS